MNMETRQYVCDCDVCKTPIYRGQNYAERDAACHHVHLIHCVDGLKQRETVLLETLATVVDAIEDNRNATYVGRKQNPELTESLMGFPIGWTDLQR